MKHTLSPLEPPYSVSVAKALERYPKTCDGYLLQLFRIFANSLQFLSDKGVVNLLDDGSPLPLREREIVILRVTANLSCEYEGGIHVTIFAKSAGFDKVHIRATYLARPNESCWSKQEKVLIVCVDDLCTGSKISDGSYEHFQEIWNFER